MLWLTGHASKTLDRQAKVLGLGLMVQPGTYGPERTVHYAAWAADNAAYARPGPFDLGGYCHWLTKFLPYKTACLFVTAPDVWADGPATLARSQPALSRIRQLGYPAALVAQPGITVQAFPWSEVDCLFIGGPDCWHRSDTVLALIREARHRALWVHRGRINSWPRVRDSQLIGCDSADGTFLRYGPDVNLLRVARWLRSLAEQPNLPLYGVW